MSNAWSLNASLCHHAIPGSFCNTQRNIRLIINNCFVIFHSWRNMRRTSPSPMMKQSLGKRPSAVPMLRPQLQQFLSWRYLLTSHLIPCGKGVFWWRLGLDRDLQSCVCFNGFDFDGVVFLKAACSKSMHLDIFGTLYGNFSARRNYILFATSKTIDWQYGFIYLDLKIIDYMII